MVDPTPRKGAIHSRVVCGAQPMTPRVGASTQDRALGGRYGGRGGKEEEDLSAYGFSMPNEAYSHGWAQAQLHSPHTGPQFPLWGAGQGERRAGPTRLKSSHPDPTQTWPWGRGEGGGRGSRAGLTCSPSLIGWPVGTDSTLASCIPAHQAIKRGSLWDVSKRLHLWTCLKGRLSGPCQTKPA